METYKRPIAEQTRSQTKIKECFAGTADGDFYFNVEDDIVGWCIAHGSWEVDETRFCKRVVSPEDLVIDIGANLGWYTVVMARQVGPHGRVIAFEPDARNFDLLTRNVEANKLSDRCALVPKALMDRAKVCTLERAPNNLGDVRVQFSQSPAKSSFGEQSWEKTVAESITLDDALAELGMTNKKVRLIKVDTQGAEVSIFRGATSILPFVDYLVTEYWPYALERAGSSLQDFHDALAPFFDEFAELIPEDRSFQPICDFEDALVEFQNKIDKDERATTYIFRKRGLGDIDSTRTSPLTVDRNDAVSSAEPTLKLKAVKSNPDGSRKSAGPEDSAALFMADGWFAKRFRTVVTADQYQMWCTAFSIFARRQGLTIAETSCGSSFVDEQQQLSATQLMAFVLQKLERGMLHTVDASIANLSALKQRIYSDKTSSQVEFHLSDSIEFFRKHQERIHLLYLDAKTAGEKDFGGEPEYQLRDLIAAYNKLSSGSLIILCDREIGNGSSHARQFLQERDWFCLIDGEKSLWLRSIDP